MKLKFQVLVMGQVYATFATRAEAETYAEEHDRESEEECGEEGDFNPWGDGAATVAESTPID